MSEANDDVRAMFRRRRTRQFIATVPAILVVVLLASRDGESISIAGLPEVVVGGLAAAAIVAVVIFSLANWRCPACERYLGRSFNPAFCSKCGARLR